MSKSYMTDALKKSRKNLKKIFPDSQDLREVNKFLSSNDTKRLCYMFDTISYYPDIDHENANAFETCQSVINTISENSNYLCSNGFKPHIDELFEIFSSLKFQGFLSALQEVDSRDFFLPKGLNLPQGYSIKNLSIADELSNAPSANNLKNTLNSVASLNNNKQFFGSRSLITGGGSQPFIPNDQPMKLVTIEKVENEDLGISVKEEAYNSSHYGKINEVIISRIMADSKIHKQGLLHVGDVIREINGMQVDSASFLQNEFRKITGPISLKILPVFREDNLASNLFVRAHFNYNPQNDTLIPAKDGGLSFKKGDVLQVIEQSDPYWWQAKKVDSNGRAGLIPSEFLQERRKAHQQNFEHSNNFAASILNVDLKPDILKKKRQVEVLFSARHAEEYQNCDLLMYEEVALISGFQRPVICLSGADGAGKTTLKNMLIEFNPERYGAPIPYTSRPKYANEVDGEVYHFDTRANLDLEYKKNAFLEYNEKGGHIYGIKYDSIKTIIDKGKTCLIECHPKTLSLLRNSDFMPYSVFIAAPAFDCLKAMYEYGRSLNLTENSKSDEDLHNTLEVSREFERRYNMLFDKIILCDNIEATYQKLCNTLDLLLIDKQWVPAAWLY